MPCPVSHRFRAPRALSCLAFLCLAGALLIAGCSDLKKSIGLERSSPDEFAVESRAPLTMPPDFNLRPPQPGAAAAAREELRPTGPPSHRAGRARRAGQAGPRFPSAPRRGRASRHRRPQRPGARPECDRRRAEPVEQAPGLSAEHRSAARAGRETRNHPAEGGLLRPVTLSTSLFSDCRARAHGSRPLSPASHWFCCGAGASAQRFGAETFTLGNGMQVVVVPNHRVPAVAADGLVQGRRRRRPASENPASRISSNI